MKIAFIVDIDPEHKTGLFNATHNRIKNIKLKNNDIKIFCLKEYDDAIISLIKKILKKKIKKNFEKSFIYENIEYEFLWIKNSIVTILLKKLNFYQYLNMRIAEDIKYKFKNFDLISSHWGITSGLIAYEIFKVIGKSYCITFHGSDIHTIPKENNKLRKYLVTAMEKASLNIFVSKKLKKQAQEIGFMGKNSIIIYNGVDKKKFTNLGIIKSKMTSEIDLNKKIVGYIGNLIWIKNADSLPEIFKSIDKKISDVQFLIIGEGEYRKQIEEKMYKDKLDSIFLGKIEPDQIPSYMKILDLLILPSRNEGMPLVTIEAKAMGIDVIASDVGGISEVIGNENVVPLNQDFIKEISRLAIEKLTTNTANTTISLSENFFWENIAEQEIEAYKKILVSNKQ